MKMLFVRLLKIKTNELNNLSERRSKMIGYKIFKQYVERPVVWVLKGKLTFVDRGSKFIPKYRHL